MEKRIPQLDYLRGLSAFGIMVYHYTTWSYGLMDSNRLLLRFGLYGVAIFYVLSGITLYTVNAQKRLWGNNLKDFFIKRIARIMPLLWLAITLTLIITSKHYGALTIFMNFSGVFGLISPNSYIAGGSWSIGNELCFYAIFPFLLWLSRKSNWIVIFFLVLFLSIHFAYAYLYINITDTFDHNWVFYVNPINQIFFFATGVLLTSLISKTKLPNIITITSMIFAIFIFIFTPTENKTELIFGYKRIIFSLASLLLVFSVYKYDFSLKGIAHKTLLWLGEISYSLYLLHPIVWYITKWIFSHSSYLENQTLLTVLISIFTTSIVSHIVYNYYERKMLDFIKNTLKAPVFKT